MKPLLAAYRRTLPVKPEKPRISCEITPQGRCVRKIQLDSGSVAVRFIEWSRA